ncbi:MAG: alpha-2-macroglobulin family protein [Hyphomonas sp.]
MLQFISGSWGTVRTITGIGLFLALTACGGGKDEPAATDVIETGGMVVERAPKDDAAARRREKRRQASIANTEQKFTYFRYRLDTSGEAPQSCFVFSGALDPDVDYEPYLEFRPTFKPALSVEGRELCVGGLAFGSNHTATLLQGLPANDGRVLAREETVPIDFEDRPPYVGFKGSGIVLPRENADGLAIETVNVDKVNITVSRVNDRALAFKQITAGDNTQQGGYQSSWGDQYPNDVSEELFSGSMQISNLQNAPVITVFPIQDVVGEMKPGAYYVTVEDAAELTPTVGRPASSRRWIMLTDLAITAYQGGQGLDVTLRSLKDGRPVPETRVQLVARNNDVLAENVTDERGRIAFDAPLLAGKGNVAPKMVLAYSAKGELAVLDLTRSPVDLSEHGVAGRRTYGEIVSYLYTDRGIYRPGETVNLSAMLRDRTGRQIEGRKGKLVLYRPNGLIADEVRFDNPESGAVIHAFELPRGANRGLWRAAVHMDGEAGRAGSVSFTVEDFVPQRIAVDLDADDKTPLHEGQKRAIEVSSRFLYGAPGAGLTVEGTARVEAAPNPFPDFEGFEFGRHDKSFGERLLQLRDITTDGAGKATMMLAPGTAGTNAGRPLRLNAVINVLEPGGRAVSESVRIPYRPEPLYIGLKPSADNATDSGGEAVYDVVAIDDKGVATAQTLNWTLLSIDYHYDWYRDGQRWRWRRSRTTTKVNEGTVNVPAGGVAQIKADGLEWGAHELIVESTADDINTSSSRGFYVGWGGSVSNDGVEAPDRVNVMVSDFKPGIGQDAEVTIVPPYAGQAQIVVATDRVLSVQNIAITEEGATVSIPVKENWGEGAYVMVSVYTERDAALQAKPRRAVGVTYVPVNMEARTFDVSLKTPEIVRPAKSQVVEVTLENGPSEPVFLTLAAVDEGILALTKFRSPDPVSYYYGKKSLGVEMYDDYGRLLDPNMGLPAEVRTGGDQLGGEGLSVVPIESVALFSGLVDMRRNGKAKIELELPQFNGEMRLMAVVWSETGLGSAQSSMVVRDKAPADLVMPRFLAPGDSAFITSSVDNVELPAGEFSTLVTGAGPVEVNDGKLAFNLQTGQRLDSPVRVEASEEGIARVRMTVEGPEKFATDRQYLIQTRSPYLPVTNAQTQLMEPGQTYAVSKDLLADFVPGSGVVTIGYSSLPVDPTTLYASLARYPYGCTEQTVSRAMPLLYSEKLVEMGAQDAKDGARTRVQAAITTLLNRQGSDGAFGLWREGDNYATPWLGAYTTDFLYRAKEAGYAVPNEALERAYNAMQIVATGESWRIYGYDANVRESRWSDETEERLMDRSSAYALYVLAKAGKADVARLRYLHDRGLGDIESPLAKAHIGAGLALMGDRSRAVSAFESALKSLGYNNSGDYYQTELRDLSGILALAAEANMTEDVATLAEALREDIPEASQLTTQEKAFLLLAVNSLSSDDGKIKLDVEGMGRGNNNDRSYTLSEEQVASGVSFKLGGKTPVFRTVMATGSPKTAPRAQSSKLRARKSFFTLTGGKVNLESVQQGDQLAVLLSVTPDERRLNPVIIADLLPAGFEIETILRPADAVTSGSKNGAFSFLGELDYAKTAQSQDDRFVAAIDVYEDEVRLAYIVRAVTPGDFAMPGVVAEDMYRPDVFGRSKSGRVSIAAAPVQAAGGR